MKKWDSEVVYTPYKINNHPSKQMKIAQAVEITGTRDNPIECDDMDDVPTAEIVHIIRKPRDESTSCCRKEDVVVLEVCLHLIYCLAMISQSFSASS